MQNTSIKRFQGKREDIPRRENSGGTDSHNDGRIVQGFKNRDESLGHIAAICQIQAVECIYHRVGSDIRGMSNLLYTIEPPEISPQSARASTDSADHEIDISLHGSIDSIADSGLVFGISLNESNVLLPLERLNHLWCGSGEHEKRIFIRLRGEKFEDVIADVL